VFESPQRLCRECVTAVAFTQTFESEEEVVWGSLSPRGRRWLQSGQVSALQSSSSVSYTEYLNKQADPVDEEMIHKDVLCGRTDPSTLGIELREMLVWVGVERYRSTVAEVLRAYCVRNPQVGYCQGLNYITAWLLLFMDPASAFWSLCALIERILTPGFYIGGRTGNSLNGFYIEATAIAALLDYYFQPVREHDLPVTDFADCFSLPLLIQLFINSLDFPSTLFLWDLLFEEGSIALVRGVVCLTYLCEEAVRAGKHPSAIHRELAQRSVEKELRVKYPKLRTQITAVRVERLRRQARDYRAFQWRSSKAMILRRLEFASHFSKPELLQFQAEFNSILQAKRTAEDKDRSRQLTAGRRKTVNLPKALQDEVGSLEGNVDIGITKFEFLGLLGTLEGRLLDHSDRLFDLFDEDKSGYLDFRELIVCLSVLTKGPFEERLRLFFDIYDQDKSGCLRKADFQQLLYAVSLPYYEQLAQSFTRPTKSLMDSLYTCLNPLASSGLVTWPDFLKTVKSDEQVRHCFELHVEVKAAAQDYGRDERERTAATCVQCALM